MVDDVYVGGTIMVSDTLYEYTGVVVPAEINKRDILGKITSVVDYYEMPSENGQANFGVKGAKYAQYEDDIVVLIDDEWILFKNKADIMTGFSVNGFGFLMEDLSDEEIYKVLRTIRKYIVVDEDYEVNLDSIIERSFIECGIEDSATIDTAKEKLKITVSYPR